MLRRSPYRLKTQFTDSNRGGGKVTRAYARALPPPQGQPVGASPLRTSCVRYIHYWRGIPLLPRAAIWRTRGPTGVRALSAGSWLDRRRFSTDSGSLRPTLLVLMWSWSEALLGAPCLLHAEGVGCYHGTTTALPGTGCIPTQPGGSPPGHGDSTPPAAPSPEGAAAEEVPRGTAPPTLHYRLPPYRGE